MLGAGRRTRSRSACRRRHRTLERSSEWYDEKLKDERATTRELRKAGRELVDQNHALEVKLAEAAGVSQELADLQDKVDAAYKETAHWKKQFTDLFHKAADQEEKLEKQLAEAAQRADRSAAVELTGSAAPRLPRA